MEVPIAEEFEKRVTAAVQALTMVDPLDENTFLGSMARAGLHDERNGQVKATLSESARQIGM